MFGRMMRSVLVVIGCWFVVEHLHDITRYFRMRDISRPDNTPTPIPDPQP